MPRTSNFDELNWHDNAIHGFSIVEGTDGCSGELVLDIDFIVEWIPPENDRGAYGFKVVPAYLTFHRVTDLVIAVDYASSTAAVQPMTIHEILRKERTYSNGTPSFDWRIEINWPRESFLAFSSDGFTQSLRGEPVVSEAQYLSPLQRMK